MATFIVKLTLSPPSFLLLPSLTIRRVKASSPPQIYSLVFYPYLSKIKFISLHATRKGDAREWIKGSAIDGIKFMVYEFRCQKRQKND